MSPQGLSVQPSALVQFRVRNFYSTVFSDTTRVGQALFIQAKVLSGYQSFVVGECTGFLCEGS